MTEVKQDNGESFMFSSATRAPFLSVITPQKVGKKGSEKGDPVYSVTLLLDPASDDLKNLKATMVRIAKATWPGRSLQELKFPIEDGNARAKAATEKGRDGSFFENMIVFTARSGMEKPPALAYRNEKGIISRLEGVQRETIGKQRFYNGCMVSCQVWLKPFYKGSEGGIGEFSGVKAYLSSVCWLADGTRIGGSDPVDTFRSFAGQVSATDPTGGAGLDDEIPF